jgi:cation diffusion facilitator CzcD-associated flavoprotein CzcO
MSPGRYCCSWFNIQGIFLTPVDETTIKYICVIGGGAAGLAALKVISDTPQYKSGLWRPVAYERRDNIGGIWYVRNQVASTIITISERFCVQKAA